VPVERTSRPPSLQLDKIHAIIKDPTRRECGVVINARTDVFLRGARPAESRLAVAQRARTPRILAAGRRLRVRAGVRCGTRDDCGRFVHVIEGPINPRVDGNATVRSSKRSGERGFKVGSGSDARVVALVRDSGARAENDRQTITDLRRARWRSRTATN